MQSGKLKLRVRFEQQTTVKNSVGEEEIAWVLYKILWASIEPLSGNELYAAQQKDSEVSTRIRIRFDVGINAKMRAVYNSLAGSPTKIEYYDVSSVQHMLYNRRETWAMCIKKDSQGFFIDGSN